MSCSKIFSGDLPELIYEIIKYFQNDFSTLHSCILVNRLWCRLAIPLLWENHSQFLPEIITSLKFTYII
uniref:F-box domain-containing protein n=1 Tax=Rhizophagus irregularis (strain DAOM 181602 / DAOM 197198 / MUCL 43194) TaxID=747089 RepID=U9T5P7_RHIID